MGLFRRQARIRRIGPNRYAVSLQDWEQGLLVGLTGDLRALLAETTDDPSVRRLFPTAYHDEPERDREYQVLARDELLQRRLEALDLVAAAAGATELDLAGLSAWMRAVNDLRLVLGTNLDVSEDDPPRTPSDDPDAAAREVYGYLTGLLAEIVDALEHGLDDPDPDEPPSP
jgi:hypothetical protein